MREPSENQTPSAPTVKNPRGAIHHRIEAALARERARIARELHDELGAALAAVRLELTAIRRSMRRQDAGTERRLARLSEVLAQCSQAKRSLVRALLSATQADADLGQVLRRLCRELRAGQGLQIDLQFLGPPPGVDVPSMQVHATYRLVQEALTNVALHAGCPRARVTVEVDTRRVWVQVQDRGRGFDPAALSGATRGLAGMQERVVELRGRWRLHSAVGAGTRISAELPLPGQSV